MCGYFKTYKTVNPKKIKKIFIRRVILDLKKYLNEEIEKHKADLKITKQYRW